MKIKVSTENSRVSVTVMHLDGDLDSASYTVFQTKASELIKNGTRHILVDLSHSPYVSSAGLRALHQIYKDLNASHTDASLNDEAIKTGIANGTYKSPYLKVLNPSDETKMVFKTSGFDMYIESFIDKKTAIASF
jgi:anti-anti-sigma factor